MPDEIRILIADDHPIVRKGLRMVLEEEPGFQVVGEASDGEAAFAAIAQLLPQIAILDIDMPKLDGFGVARRIAERKLPVETIFLTLHNSEDFFQASLDAGAKGYILKDSVMQEIVAGVIAVAAGRRYIGSALMPLLLERRAGPPVVPEESPVSSLTPTERRIVQLVAADKSSKEIGQELSIHYRTIENHRTNICRKLGIEGANALLRFALQNRDKL